MRSQGNDMDVRTQYDTPAERIFNDARNSEGVIVLAIKGGVPHLWADGNEKKAQELLSQYFPSAVLPEPELEDAGQRTR